MKISQISWKNFLSYGNVIQTIDFTNPETILINGKNGFGKSSILDIIHYNLSGKPFRDINVDKLINRKNKKELYTEGIYISDNGIKIKIIRTRKPDVLQIFLNDNKTPEDFKSKDDTQNQIERLLNFNYKNLSKTFLISTSNYKSFFRLSADEKRKFIDFIFEIESFSKMTESIKKDRTVEKEILKEVDFTIDKLKSNIELIENYNKKIIKDDDEEIQEIKKRIKEIKNDILFKEDENKSNQTKLNDILSLINQFVEKDSKQTEAIFKLQKQILEKQSILQAKKDIEAEKQKFFNENQHCQTCQQEISSEHKKNILWEIEKQFLNFDSQQNGITDLQEKLFLYKEKNSQLKNQIDLYEKQKEYISKLLKNNDQIVNNLQYEYQSIQTRLKSLTDQNSNDFDDSKLNDLIKQLNVKYDEKIQSKKQLDIIEKALESLGEKYLRSYVINQYIPVINKSLKKYLEIFELPFQVIIDKEFNESFLSKDYNDLNYESLSEGEKKRVDLSLLFSFFDLNKFKMKQSCNVLILDEILDGSLDIEGINGLKQIINMFTNEKISVIIISHNVNVKELIDFTKFIEIKKQGGFSKIYEN